MQDLIIYNENQVIVQANGRVYQDTQNNFILDYGELPKIKVERQSTLHPFERFALLDETITNIDYNRDTKSCWLNGNAFQKYPNELCEDILNSIDTLITNKEKREYVAPSLEELKQAKLTELKTIRDTEEVKPIEYNDNLFDFDDKARDRINNAIIALSITGQSIEWTTADNTNVLVTADDLRGIVANVAVRSNELHVKYRELKECVENCTTKEELDKIQWEEQ